MSRQQIAVLVVFSVCFPWLLTTSFAQVRAAEPKPDVDQQTAADSEAKLLTHIRQLTFEGRRAGEGQEDVV